MNVFGGFERFLKHAYAFQSGNVIAQPSERFLNHAYVFQSQNVIAQPVNVFGGFERFLKHAYAFQSCRKCHWTTL